MDEFLLVLALAAMPALGNSIGGALAEVITVSPRLLSLALHLAAGIVLAVVGVELMPQVLEASQSWVIVLAFLAGGGFAVGLDVLIGKLQKRVGGAEGNTGPWLIFAGVAVDLFSDGLLIGTGSTISLGLGLLLALGQVAADLPEGFATIASFKATVPSRRKRLLLAASFILPILLGATIGYWLVRGRPELLKLGLLSFTAAILTATAVEEIIGEAHETAADARWEELLFIAGFALFMALSLYLE